MTIEGLSVKRLRYVIESSANYEGAKSVTVCWPECTVTLDKDVAVVTMTAEFDSFERAKNAVEPYLLNWEIDAGLKYGREVITFRYDGGEGTDKNGNWIRNVVSYADLLRQLQSTKREYPYPSPPSEFQASEEVQEMWRRYCLWRKGREPLGSMAYYCLTVAEKRFCGRKEASRKLGISNAVMDKIGQLSSEYGDRKATALRPHTKAEQDWLAEAIRILIRRLGEYEAGKSPETKVDMSGLPALT